MMQQISGMQYRRIDPAVESMATKISLAETPADRPRVRAMAPEASSSSTSAIACPNEIAHAMNGEPPPAVDAVSGCWCGAGTTLITNDKALGRRSQTDGTDGLIDDIPGAATPPRPSASPRPSDAGGRSATQERATHHATVRDPAAAPPPAAAAFTHGQADHVADAHAALAGPPAPRPPASTCEPQPADLSPVQSEPARPDTSPADVEAGGDWEWPTGADRRWHRRAASAPVVPSAVALADAAADSEAPGHGGHTAHPPAAPPANAEHRPAPVAAELWVDDCGEEGGGEGSDAWPATGGTCLVCLDAAADAVLVECGHGGLCAGAATRAPFTTVLSLLCFPVLSVCVCVCVCVHVCMQIVSQW